MASLWKPLITVLITFALAVSLKNDFLFFLLGFEVMMLVVAYVQVIYLSKKADMKVVLPQTAVYKKDQFFIQVELLNSSILPIPQLQVKLGVKAFPDKEELLLKGKLMLNSKEKGNLCFSLDSSHCGCLEIHCDKLIVTDFLGIFQKKCVISDREIHRLFILPESLSSNNNIPEISGQTPFEDGESDRKGTSSADASDIRAYQRGDLRKLIHWKISARLGELMVRELTDPTEKLVWLYLKLQEDSNLPEVRNNPDLWDNFVETVASVSYMLNNVNKRHFVIWLDDETKSIVKHTVFDEKTLQEMICSLLRTNTYTSAENSQLLKEIYSDETKGTCVEISLQGVIVSTED